MKYLIFCILFLNFSVKLSAMPVPQLGPLEIITLPHPTLYEVAIELPLDLVNTNSMQKYLDDMIATMKSAGGVGLAAPQVNRSERFFVIKPTMFGKAEVFINPTLEYISQAGTKTSTEGCLSIPNKSYKVERYKEIHVTYYDRYGKFIAEKATGFRAIVIQHEYDHLNGILISDIFASEFFDSSEVAPLM
jgi:peptide deformylase